MDIIIISQYLRNIEILDGNNSRFIYLADMLSSDKKNEVEIVTSNFMHGPKKHAENIKQPIHFKITAINEPGYSQNICMKRFVSHHKLAKNIKRYLEQRRKPDCIYCAIPSLVVANIAADYCKKYNIRLIIDIQDLWPEAFKMVCNVPIISDLILVPMKFQANKIYRSADTIIAVSQTYVDRALQVNHKCKKSYPVFLGTKLSSFDQYAIQNIKELEENSNEIKIVYCGSLSASYDLKCVIDALYILINQGYSNLKFIIMGDGKRKSEFEEYAKEKGVFFNFTGMLPYPEMVAKLCTCDIAVNPIKKGSAGSIINKVGDYAMAGLPVVNTQECQEYRNLIEIYNAGINCESSSIKSVKNAIETLVVNEKLRKSMGKGNRKMAVERFDRKHTYQKIINAF